MECFENDEGQSQMTRTASFRISAVGLVRRRERVALEQMKYARGTKSNNMISAIEGTDGLLARTTTSKNHDKSKIRVDTSCQLDMRRKHGQTDAAMNTR